MKQIGILLVITVMLVTGSCTSFSGKNELKTDIDTLSYFYGISQTDGVMNFLTMQAGIDTAYLDAFYKGFKDGSKNFSAKDAAYYEGVRIAHMINNQWVDNMNKQLFMGDSGYTVNRTALLSGFLSGVKHADQINITQANSYSQVQFEKIKDEYRKTKFAELIAAGEKFLVDNKSKEGVVTTNSGLQYKVIKQGDGVIPDDRSRVLVNFRGTLVDGTEFDNSYKNNEPSSFHTTQVIRGWTEALLMMPLGSKWELYVPQELAYGKEGLLPEIPPYAMLIFEIELVEVITY